MTLDDQLVDPGTIDDVPDSINAKDRHVIAAALAGEAPVIVTNDKRLHAETKEADIGLVPMSADEFAAHLWTLMPEDLNEVIGTLVAKRTKRPVTADELMEAMRGSFPTMASAWFAART